MALLWAASCPQCDESVELCHQLQQCSFSSCWP